MPIPFNPENPSFCLVIILTLLYSATLLAIYRYCHLYLLLPYTGMILCCICHDWRTHYHQKPYTYSEHYPPQWWKIDDTPHRCFMTDQVTIPYISQHCIVLIISSPDRTTHQYVQLWFDSMASISFHNCIRSSKGYASMATSGTSIVGSAIAY